MPETYPPGQGGLVASSRVRVLAVVTVTTALAVVAAGLATGAAGAASPSTGVLAPALCALAATVLAHSARIRIPVRGGYALATWGEAAVLLAVYVVPPTYVPGVLFLGALLAAAGHAYRSHSRSVSRAVRSAANVSLAGAAAALAARLVTVPTWADFSPRLVLALLLAAVVYVLVVTVLFAWASALATGVPLRPIITAMFVGKLVMSMGNIAIGLLVVLLLGSDPRWLLVLPPGLWLMQQGYGYQLRMRDERHSWGTFARVTRALNQLDEAAVARAAIDGARELFGADLVEVVVNQPGGGHQVYGAPPPAEAGAGVRHGPPVTGLPPGPPAELQRRTLQVGGSEVGELRVRCHEPMTPAGRLSLSAFADALAAALHDAAGHHRLSLLAARTSHEAAHDPLTGLANRRTFQWALEAALIERNPGEPVALVMLDVNRFREVNDTLGHAAGDRLLVAAAARLGSDLAPGETLGRLGGDEFALLLGPGTPVADADPAANPVVPRVAAAPDVPPDGAAPHDAARTATGAAAIAAARARATLRARRLLDVIATPTEVNGVLVVVEASAGLAVVPAGAADATELLRRADIGLHQAKREGAVVTAYADAVDAGSIDRLATLAELREALTVQDQLVLVAQPVCDLATRGLVGIEALVRWRHPRRGMLAPAEFVPVVEASELLTPFTRYVLDAALRLAGQWRARGLAVPVGVNLSARSLRDRSLPDEVERLLTVHDVPARQLVVEITETVVVPERPVVGEVLAALRALGVGVAVNDFGTGHSSLTFLTRVTVDEIKIDRSFVALMGRSPQAAAIVRTTIDLGRRLGLRVVAVGVETAEQAAALAELGCPAVQGYHLFPPLDPEDLPLAVAGDATVGP